MTGFAGNVAAAGIGSLVAVVPVVGPAEAALVGSEMKPADFGGTDSFAADSVHYGKQAADTAKVIAPLGYYTCSGYLPKIAARMDCFESWYL